MSIDNNTYLDNPELENDLQEVLHPIECEAPNEQVNYERGFGLLKYLVAGIFFGIIFIKAEIISWFRIQEMFRFQSFHMYGVIGSAVLVGLISVFLIKRFNIPTLNGESIRIGKKEFRQGQIYGGFIFGLGWALTGACPGPLFAQIGAGYLAIIVTLFAAIAGTWLYGRFQDKLPN